MPRDWERRVRAWGLLADGDILLPLAYGQYKRAKEMERGASVIDKIFNRRAKAYKVVRVEIRELTPRKQKRREK